MERNEFYMRIGKVLLRRQLKEQEKASVVVLPGKGGNPEDYLR